MPAPGSGPAGRPSEAPRSCSLKGNLGLRPGMRPVSCTADPKPRLRPGFCIPFWGEPLLGLLPAFRVRMPTCAARRFTLHRGPEAPHRLQVPAVPPICAGPSTRSPLAFGEQSYESCGYHSRRRHMGRSRIGHYGTVSRLACPGVECAGRFIVQPSGSSSIIGQHP